MSNGQANGIENGKADDALTRRAIEGIEQTVLSIEIDPASLDAMLAMEKETQEMPAEGSVASPASCAQRPATAPLATTPAGAVAGGALSARSAGASNSKKPLNRSRIGVDSFGHLSVATTSIN